MYRAVELLHVLRRARQLGDSVEPGLNLVGAPAVGLGGLELGEPAASVDSSDETSPSCFIEPSQRAATPLGPGGLPRPQVSRREAAVQSGGRLTCALAIREARSVKPRSRASSGRSGRSRRTAKPRSPPGRSVVRLLHLGVFRLDRDAGVRIRSGGRDHRGARRALAADPPLLRGTARRPRGASRACAHAALGAQYVVVGAFDVLAVVLAIDVLGLGDSGAGYLNAAFGAGAVIGAVATVALIGARRLAPPLLAGAALLGAPLIALCAFPTALGAFALLAMAGAGRIVLDVSGRTLLQRAAPSDFLSRTFALLEAVSMAGSGVGFDPRAGVDRSRWASAALVGCGALLPIVALLRRRDASLNRLGRDRSDRRAQPAPLAEHLRAPACPGAGGPRAEPRPGARSGCADRDARGGARLSLLRSCGRRGRDHRAWTHARNSSPLRGLR